MTAENRIIYFSEFVVVLKDADGCWSSNEVFWSKHRTVIDDVS